MRAFIALLLVAAATAKLAPLHKNSEPIPGKYIIKLKDGYEPDAVASTVRVSGGRVRNIFRNVLNGFAAELSKKILDIVRNHPAVEYVEQDGVYRATAYTTLWNLDRIDQRPLGRDNDYSPAYGNGAGVSVYIADTGIRASHNDFGGSRGRASCVYSAIVGEDCDDGNGHGTHCAGTIGGDTYGVAKGVTLKGVKVLGNSGSGSTIGIITALNWIKADASGPSVVSMSLGGGASSSLDNAVANLVSAGITVVVAAGNSNADACNYSPARAPDAITVGATDSSDARSSFSNWGSCVDIFAPGSSITSAWWTGDDKTNTISGTSMACPHVAGASALVLGQNPNSTPAEVTSTILGNATPDKITNFRLIDLSSPNLLLFVGNDA